jgi:type IV pilus assembly protein PilB
MFKEYQRLGDILVRKGLLNEDRLNQALTAQASCNSRLGEILSAMGWLSEEDLARALAEQYDYDFVEVQDLEADPEALKLVTGRWSLAKLILPFGFTEGRLDVVIADPIDVESTDELRARTGAPLKFSIARASALRNMIIRSYTLETETAPKKKFLKRRIKVDHQVDKSALLNALDRLMRGAA